MKQEKIRKKATKKAPPRGGATRFKPAQGNGQYSPAQRLGIVRMHLDEGHDYSFLARETGVSASSIANWVESYKAHGEAGIQNHPRTSWPKKAKSQANAPVTAKIVEIKRDNPSFGVKRISQFLRRMLFLEASPAAVLATLQEEKLMPPSQKRKAKKNPPKPRFFERATPNQMWQSDIFTFRLGGKNAYLIGFVDDYSRYMVGLDLFRSQTAENMLEVFRSATGEYGIPKEMLTDNGRQYVAWRGKTRFQMELAKDRIQHIRSAPHHPMTLGKIERFWQTIWEEFLGRAQFDSYEAARDRVRLWTKYYNHRRPHQGIGGMCPADRFFEIQNEMRKVIEKGVAENVLEQALRGKPRAPFYMVGRLGSKSVVLRAEKGNVKFEVDGVETDALECDLEEKANDNDDEGKSGEEGEPGAEGEKALQCVGEGSGGAVDLDGAAEAVGGLQGAGDQLGEPAALGEPRAGGDDGGTGTADAEGGGAGAGLGHEAAETSGEEFSAEARRDVKTSPPPDEDTRSEAGEPREGGDRIEDEAGRESAAAGGDDHEGAERALHDHGRREGTGCIKEDILRVGEEGAGGDGDGFDGLASRPTFHPERLGEGSLEGEARAVGA
jgi:transposase InsO family protein